MVSSLAGGILIWILIFSALWATSLYNFLLFHTVAELFSIIIAGTIFVIAWSARRTLDNGYLLFVGIAYLFVAFLDLAHTLSYKGMGIFQDSGANLSTQFWIGARYLEAISLFLAPFFLSRKFRFAPWLLAYSLASGLFVLSILFWGIFPPCYIEGLGLTWFKKGSEYVICLIFLGAGALLWHHRIQFNPRIIRLLIWSMATTILAELAFTFYVDVYGLYLIIGHFAKIFSFFLIYRALVETGVTAPQEMLFRRLSESELRLRTLMADSFDGIFLQKGSKIIFANQKLHQMAGYESGELVGKKHWLIYHPDFQDTIRMRAAARMRGEDVVSRYEVKIQRKDGAHFEAEVRAKAIMVEGKPGVQVWVRDIGERKRAEEQLVRTAREWQTTFDAAKDVIWILDKDQRILRSNQAVERILGWSSKNAAGKHCWEIVHATTQPIPECPLARAQKSLRRETMELQIGGGWFAVVVDPILDSTGQYGGAVHIISNITERKLAEEELRASEARFQALVENSPVGTVLTSSNGDYLYANPKFVEMFGYTLTDVPNGEAWLRKAFPNPSARNMVRNVWHEDLCSSQPGEARPRVFEVTCKDNSRKIILFRTVTLDDGRQLITYEDISERQRSEEALRKSQEKYTKLYKASPAWLLVSTLAEGRFLEVNDAFCLAMGYRREEMLGRTSAEINMWVDIDDRKKYLAQMASQGFVREFPVQFRQKNGTIRDFLWSAEKIEVDGEACAISVLLDVTESILTRKALEKSEAQYRNLFENVYDFICTHDLDGWITQVNPVVVNTLGYTQEELFSMKISDLIPEKYRQEFDSDYLKTIKEKGVAQGTMQMTAKNGDIHFVEYRNHLVRDEDNYTCVIGLASDITGKVKIEANLKESQEQFRAAFENAPMGMALIDVERRFVKINNMLCQMLGYSQEELLGKSFNRFTHPEDRQGGRDRWNELVAGQVSNNQAEKRYICKNGKVLWIIVSNSALRNRQGQTQYMVSHFFDITELKEAHETSALLETQLRQAQKMEAVGTLAGGIAHDFNNILAAIMGYTELVAGGLNHPNKCQKYLAQIKVATNRARDLVRQILTFSRKTEVARQPLNLNRCVTETVELIEQTIPKMIRLELNLHENPWLINGDPGQIAQIVMNLATNANDAMPEGGRLLIETENVFLNAEYCREHLEAEPGGYVRLQISDTGLGIPKEVAPQIFDPFFTTKETGKGTGLGLSTVYGIVQSHGGLINCYSEPGQGTTFKIYFPALQTEEELALEKTKAVGQVLGGSETILVVDDETPIQDVCRHMLSQSGYEVVIASNGEEALEVLQHNRNEIDLVVLDLNMPGMGGTKCLQEIIKLDSRAKVLVASGYSREGLLKDNLAAGAAGCLEKPFTRENLLGAIRQILDKGMQPLH